MVDPEDAGRWVNRMLRKMAAQVARNLREAERAQRIAFQELAAKTREFARVVRELDDRIVPPIEFRVPHVLTGLRGVKPLDHPVDASGAIRYQSNIGEFNFTPWDEPSLTGSNRAARNLRHTGVIGEEMLGTRDNPYIPAFPYYLENGRQGVIQFRTGTQIAVPPSRSHSYELAAMDFVTNNVRDAHVGRPFNGLQGIRINEIGELKAIENWRTFDWSQPIAANPVVARHSGHLFDRDTHARISQTDPAALGNRLLRAGMDKMDVAEVLERIAMLQQLGGVPALNLLDRGPL